MNNSIPPKDSDSSCEECSINVELDDLPSLLELIVPLIDAGFAASEARQVSEMAKGMSVDEEKSLKFPVIVGGQKSLLTIRIFMDDIASPDVCWIAEPSLCERIRAVLDEYFSNM